MKRIVLRVIRGLTLSLGCLLFARSAPAAAPFFFIQLSDPQFGMFTDNKEFAQETANFEFAVAAINRLKPAFVIITGDLVNKPGDPAQIAEFQRISRLIHRDIPVYNVAGNHDIENVPTPATVGAYTNEFGPDRFTFRHGEFAGVVLNSSVIHSPLHTTNEMMAQEQWLRDELARLRTAGTRHIVVFQHHPWFLKSADEPDQYFNIPSARRATYLALFREAGVKYLFSGHYHQNAVARTDDLEAVTTGPVGKPLGSDKSGLRVVIVRDEALDHRYYHFGELPTRIDPAPKPVELKQKGAKADLGGRTATLRKLDTLPYVESEYTRRFKFDSYTNPKLATLREHYHLDEVIAPGRDELSRQVLLMDWVHRQFKKFGQPSTNAHGALEILDAIKSGHTFFCSQYATLFVSCAASLGWIDRPLALRRHQGVNQVGGSTEHSVTEMWSNQHRKWVMFDPTSNMILEKNGRPLSAYEIRQEWFYEGGTNLTFVVGAERKRYRKGDLPIVLRHFDGFGDLAVHPDELDKYGFTAYIPNTDLMDAGFDYARMFIVQDQLCDGTRWHVRTVPEHPASDPYFPIGQAALSLRVDAGKITVALQTMTPNFKQYEVRLDGKPWEPSPGKFVWNIQAGTNRLEARTLNQFGIHGPASSAELVVTAR